ncbi:MAG TPA: S8 family serine peptidase, partial [Candidatus Hydrogenedentes bacterium]|nr:S8 family serine peptidase [Candidatus Hydrogenedentota bacterium]
MKLSGYFLLFSCLVLSFHVQAQKPSTAYVPDELLVRFRETTTPKSIADTHKSLGATVIKRLDAIGVDHIKLSVGKNPARAVAEYESLPMVVYAEPNYYRYAQGLPPNPVVPTDPRFADQWGLHNTGRAVNGTVGLADADIDAPEAWRYPLSSQEVVVAVIDSGICFDHPDLAEVFWVNPDEIPDDGVDNDGNGYVDDAWGWDFVGGHNAPWDENKHGSHVAGVVAAARNNANGVCGVVSKVKILPLRILDSHGVVTTVDAMASAFGYTKILKDAGQPIWIVNCSVGGPNESSTAYLAIQALAESGILVCAAAGNDPATDNDNPSTSNYPSSYTLDNIIAVAASDSRDQFAPFSHWGAASVDLAAPGVDILSTVPYRIFFEDDFECEQGKVLTDWWVSGTNAWWGLEELSDGNCWMSDSPSGYYAPYTDSFLELVPTITFPLGSGVSVEFYYEAYLDLCSDFLSPEIVFNTDWSSWLLMGEPIYGGTGIWQEPPIYVSGASQAAFCWYFYSNGLFQNDGVYLDNFKVKVWPPNGAFDGTELEFMPGTSMASPMVAGAAAFLKSVEPGLSCAQIKALILANVDPITMPPGKQTLTNGRLNLHNAVRMIDYDEDEMILEHELQYGTDPHKQDTDNDGLSDGTEDTNANGILDSSETSALDGDTDGDGLGDGAEIATYETDPLLADTDADGLDDGAEVATHGTDPLLADTDADGLDDGAEVATHGTDPLLADTDADGLDDGAEVATHG